MQDKIFRVLLILSAVVVPLIGGGIIYSLTVDSTGAFEEFGFWNFVFSDDWVTTAGKEKYGALPFITGTLLTTFLALIMCIPFSLPVALFTGEYFRGKKIATFLGTVTDLLAGIPSIIYGLWGFYILRGVFMELNFSPQGSGILTAAFVLAIMIVPYAASLSAEFIKMVPSDLKEGAYAMGATRAEVIDEIGDIDPRRTQSKRHPSRKAIIAIFRDRADAALLAQIVSVRIGVVMQICGGADKGR